MRACVCVYAGWGVPRGGGGGGHTTYATSTDLCLPLGSSLLVSSPSHVTKRGLGESMMMLLDENRNCHSK